MKSTLSLLDFAVEAVSQLLTASPSQRNHAGDGARGAGRRSKDVHALDDAARTIGSQRATRFGGPIGAPGISSAKAHPSTYFAIPLDLEAATV